MNFTQCVFCDVTTNLNTSLTITLEDGSKVAVNICDGHAEDATVKSAREAYLGKLKKIDDLLAQVKALGLQISDSPSGMAIVSQPPKAVTNTPSARAIDPIEEGPDIIPTSKLQQRNFQSVGGNVAGVSVPSYEAINPANSKDKLPDDALDGYAEMAIVEGRGGQPLAIPKRRTDKTGTTVVTIKKSTDANLQDRFKKMANDSLSDRMPDFANGGYNDTQRECPICHGSGHIIQQRKPQACPKCNGSGIISRY